MKILVAISRYFVGILFIFSGLIKANDPLGFAYKLQEFYDVFGNYPVLNIFDNPFFHGLVLETSILVCVLEVILGFALILGSYPKWTTWILLLLMIFFTFLTGFASVTGEITECGCFGDAIPLSTDESFIKDLILMVFTVILFIGKDKINPLIPKRAVSDGVLALSVIGTIVFTLVAYHHLPYIDFRSYAPGNNICELLTLGPDAQEPVYETTLVYRNTETGEEKEFSMKNFPKGDEWKFVEQKTTMIQEGDLPEIQDFILSDKLGNDITDEFLQEDGYKFLVIMYNLDKTKTSRMDELNELQQQLEENGYTFYGLTASVDDKVEDFRHKHQTAFPYLIADETVLKTVVRSNPGLVMFDGCEVAAKWHWRDLPSYESLEENYFN